MENFIRSPLGAKMISGLPGRLSSAQKADKKVKKQQTPASGGGSVMGTPKAQPKGQNAGNGVVRDGKSVLG
jgi:hypothetical protein